MNEKRCATCKYWQMWAYMTEGRCARVLDVYPDTSKPPVEMRGGEGADRIVFRNQDMNARLSTGPQFGCIHWEVNDSGRGPMITEQRFGLSSLHVGTRHFTFSVPFEVLTRKTPADNWISVDCAELEIAASNPREFAVLFAGTYDHITNRDDGELTPLGLQFKQRLVDDVTEEAQASEAPDNYWSFGFARPQDAKRKVSEVEL